jgi:hypothetical protein
MAPAAPGHAWSASPPPQSEATGSRCCPTSADGSPPSCGCADALAQQLLAPFDYYGLADGTDLRRVRWTRDRLRPGAALADLYTGNEARVRPGACEQLAPPGRRPALGARPRASASASSTPSSWPAHVTALGRAGAGRPRRYRADTSCAEAIPARLRERDVNLLFTCDLYNEGVDLPYVDVLAAACGRPMSTTMFLQQLGRGLRHARRQGRPVWCSTSSASTTTEYHHEPVLAAMTGMPRAQACARPSNTASRCLPSGCSLRISTPSRASRCWRQLVARGRCARLADDA